MKNVLMVVVGLLIFSSCKDKDIVAVESVSLSSASLKLSEKGTSLLKVTITPENATDGSIEWASSNSDVATVADGVVTAVKAGTTTITAKSKSNTSKTDACRVTVIYKAVDATGISLNPAKASLLVGGTLPIVALPEPANATDSITWTSSDEIKATVSATGLVTGKALGTATITAASLTTVAIKASCQITITATSVVVTSLSLTPPTMTLAVGQAQQLKKTILPENATNQNVTYSSDKADIAVVSAMGLVTAKAKGTAIITATAVDGSGVTGTTTLTVPGNDVSISAITLGTENFSVTLSTAGPTTTLVNAPRTISSNLTAVPVTITAAANATIKSGTTTFTQGQQPVNFTGPVTFTVTAEDGITTRDYTLAITAYNAVSNPYGVYTVAHLHDVRNDKAGSYKMMNNISLPARNVAGAAATSIEDYAAAGWLPIAHDAPVDSYGQSTSAASGAFTGTFDGGNNSINDVFIKRTGVLIAFFALTDGATIKNLGVNGATDSISVTSNSQGAMLIGRSNNSTVTNCYATGNVLANSSGSSQNVYAGGLIGTIYGGSVSNSYSTSNVTAISTGGSFPFVFSGGLSSGYNNAATFTNCYATGNVVTSSQGTGSAGGLLGFTNNGSISNCYSIGNVTNTYQSQGRQGALIGATYQVTYTNNYRNSNAVVTSNGSQATLDDGSTAGITAKTKTEMQDDAFTTLLGISVWGRDSRNGGLPYIKGVGIGK